MRRAKSGTSSGTSQLVTYALSTVSGSAFRPARSAFQWTAVRLLIAGDNHARRQVGKRLPGRGDDHDRPDDSGEHADDTLQHRLGTKGQQRL